MRQLQHVTVLWLLRENVALASDVTDERHHDLFANRVNRRIGDLREELLEIIEQRLRTVRETSERRIRPHRYNQTHAADEARFPHPGGACVWALATDRS